MKKTVIFALLMIPFLSFGQLTKKQKKSVDAYTVGMCTCINDLMAELPSEVNDVVIMMAEKGEEAAMGELEAMMADMTPDEIAGFLEGFQKMESTDFTDRIEDCDDKGEMAAGIAEEIDSMEGEAFDHFMSTLKSDDACKLMYALYSLGTQATEE